MERVNIFYREKNDKWNSPYKFNAKELDEETGLYYYGARYFDSKISIWLSVDPKMEKYPHMSPYNYAANNPVKYIDPDGRDIVLPKGTSTKDIYTILGNLQKLTNDKLVYSTQKDGTIRIKIASLGKGNKTAGTRLIRRLNSSNKTVTIDIKDSQGNFLNGIGNKAKATNYTDAANGKGSDAIVSFDPTSNPDILTINPKNRLFFRSKKTKSNWIGTRINPCGTLYGRRL
ncbi:MAG: RHS repeat-associated core domain-containing protein [Flavobacteriaceae bacterium]|jgi:RHS repeat-associated protein|nr:RHS repeat-associated core domain-containing protein [Flavobacteriaceae bacterium]